MNRWKRTFICPCTVMEADRRSVIEVPRARRGRQRPKMGEATLASVPIMSLTRGRGCHVIRPAPRVLNDPSLRLFRDPDRSLPKSKRPRGLTKDLWKLLKHHLALDDRVIRLEVPVGVDRVLMKLVLGRSAFELPFALSCATLPRRMTVVLCEADECVTLRRAALRSAGRGDAMSNSALARIVEKRLVVARLSSKETPAHTRLSSRETPGDSWAKRDPPSVRAGIS